MTAAPRQIAAAIAPTQDLQGAAPLRAKPPAPEVQALSLPLGLALLTTPPPALPSATGWVDDGIARLAAPLGLSTAPGLVRFGRDGFSSAASRGRVEAGRIVLHPDRFRPNLPEGRAVLAHELAHLAQARLAPRTGRDALILAELEAREVGRRAAEGRMLPRVQRPVAASAVLFDDTLAVVVGRRYATELARFRDLLRGWLGFLWVTDGAIREALTLIEGLDFEVVKSFGGLLTAGERETFLDNVSPGHFDRFRREILAIYSVTEASLIAQQDEGLFQGMDFSGLLPAEVVALGEIFAKGYSANAIARLRESSYQGPHLRRLLDSDLIPRAHPLYDAAGAETRALTALQADLAARAAAAEVARRDETSAAAIDRLVALLRDPNDDDRIAALDILSGFLGHAQIFEGILQAVQPPEAAAGALDRMLDGFPEHALVAPVATPPEGGTGHSRIETLLRIATLRPPWKNVALVESLLSSAWIFNVITSSEAFLAFQLVKALPDSVRSGLLEESGGRLGTLLYSSLSQSIREAAGTNFYRGGEGRLDLASIQSQLMDDTLWSPEQIGRLGGLIRMAGAAGEQEWVFNRSHQAALANPTGYEAATVQAQIVEPFMLYGSTIRGGGQRTAWEPAYGAWAIENVWDMLGESVATIGRGVALLGDSREPGALIGNALFGRSLGGEGISAVALQNLMGGSFMGIRFVSPKDRIDNPELAAEVARADEADRGVNYVDRALWDTDRGVIEMVANNLAVAAVRYPMGDMLISTGPGRIRSMDLTLGYPTRETGPRPTTMDLRIDTLELNDLLIVQRGAMLGINRIELRGFEVDLGRDAFANRLPEAGRGIDPWTMNPVTPILRLVGLTLGSELTDRSAEIVTALTEPVFATPMVITVDALTLTGVLTSGGQYVETVQIEEAQIGITGTVDDYREILSLSVRANIAHKVRLMRMLEDMKQGDERGRVAARIDSLSLRVAALQGLIRDILASQETVQRLAPLESSLSQADRDSLAAARAALAPFEAGGITFDAGRLRVAGLQGRVTASDVDLADIHGRGQGAAGLLAFLTDSEALGRIVDGPAHVRTTAPRLGRAQAEFTLELGNITLDEVRVGAGIPTVAEAGAALRTAEAAWAERRWDPALIAARDAAAERAAATDRYQALAAAGATHLSPADARKMTELHDRLLAEEALYVHHLDATGARLGFSAGQGSISFSAETFAATGDGENGTPAIRAGDVTIGGAQGRNIDLSVSVADGLHNFSDFARRLGTIGLGGEFVRLEDMAIGASGLSVSAAEGSGFNLSLNAQAGVLRGQAEGLGGEGIRSRITRPWLMQQITAMQGKPAARVTDDDRRALRELRDALDILDAFEAGLEENQAALAAAADPAIRTRLATERQTSIAMFLHWERRLGARTAAIQGLDAEVTGLRNLAENDFDFGAAVEAGITVQGLGRGRERTDRIFAGASLSDARFGGLDAGQIEMGETAGRLRYSTSEIVIEDLGIDSLTLGALLWTSRSEVAEAKGGGWSIMQIFSHGATVASGIRVSAVLRFVPTVEDPGQYRLDHVNIGPLRIDRLQADGLGYGSTRHPPVFGMADPHGIFTGQDFTLDGGDIVGLWAEGIEVDMPDTAAEEMQITGHAGVESISRTRVSAFLENTLTGHARLDGSALSIEFLESGGQIIDIGARTDADGRISYEGGLRLGEGEVRLSQGSAAFSTGTITGRIHREGRVTRFEGIAVPSLVLQQLAFTSPSFKLEMPGLGGRIVLSGTEVEASIVTAEPGSHAPFEQITINSLVVPTATLDGVRLTFPHKIEAADESLRDLILTVPTSETVTLTNFRLAALPGASAFVITPDPTGVAGPQIDGRLHLDRAQGARLALEIERKLHATSDVEASDLDFDFLGAGGFSFTLAQLELMRTTVGLGEQGGAAADHIFTITSAAGGSARAAAPHATIRGLSYGADGSVTITSAALAGLLYRRPAWGVEVDIGSAELPTQASGASALSYTPGDSLLIPELKITDAAFVVDDVMAIGGGTDAGADAGSGGAATPPVLSNLDFLDALHGTVGLTLGHPSLPDIISERLDLRLEHGVFDLDHIENEIGANFLIDFDLEGDRLVLNLDYGNVTLATSVLPFLNHELAAFHLQTPNEIREADARKIRLSTMAQRFESSGSSGSGGEVPLSIRDIDADLMLEPTRVDLTGHDSILMGGAGRDGALGIDVTGGLFPSTSGHRSQLDIAIREVNASVDPAHPLTFGGVSAQTGELTITNVHDTRLTFHGVTTPRRLSGVIGGAVIRNLRIEGL